MRLAIVKTILFKELRETLRDRRTLFALFVLPVLIHPLLLVFMGSLTAADERARKSDHPQIAVWGPLASGDLLDEFEIADRREDTPPDAEAKAREMLERGQVQLVLVAPSDARARLDGDDGVAVDVYFDSLRNTSDGANDRLKKALTRWNEKTVAARLATRQLPSGFAKPLKLEERNLASKQREVTVRIGRALPLIMLIVMLTCGFLPAADLTAGEKERGTLQTLLCAPLKPIEIVSGKYLAVVLVSLLGGAANLVAMSFALARFASNVADVEIHFGWSTALAVFASMVPTALLLGALLLTVAVFARSFREAQSYMTPMIFLALVPAMMAMRPGVELTPMTAFIPVENVALLTGAIFAGRATATLFFFVMLANLAYAGAAMVLAARVFEAEQVLLSGEKPWRDLFGRSDRVAITPSPGEAVLFGVVVLVGVYYGSLWADPHRLGGINRTILIVQTLLLLPPVVWTVVGRHSLSETLRLTWPSARGAAGILMMALGGWSVGLIAYWAEAKLFPGASAWAEAMKNGFGELDATTIILIALAPAVSEEICCRGFMMSGLGNSGLKWVAVVGSAAFFAILHINPYHMVIAGALGLLLGFATLESGTILAGAAIHAVNNGFAAASSRIPQLATLRSDPKVVAVALTMTLAGAWLVRGSRK